ncbi:MAG: hypothetical protein P9L99_09645 [Candidatus Lernaella stagnicola]|nr:hypothetical protein [Candidatus Lernaella stagnicola]
MNPLTITEEESVILRDALLEAARRIVHNTTGARADLIVLDVWREAIHRVLQLNGCACVRGDAEHCFLRWPEAEQQKALADHDLFALQAFHDMVMEGLFEMFVPADH